MTISSQRNTLLAFGAVLAALAVPATAAAGNGDSSERVELDNGRLLVEAGNGADAVALRLQAGDATRIQVDFGDDGSAEATVPRANVATIEVKGGNGPDALRIDDTNGAFTDTIPTTIAGENGGDTLQGGAGAELLKGGRGEDHADGGRGNDTGRLGRGDDTFQWDPGEGSDVIEGRAGLDTMLFNGAGGATGDDDVVMSANGGRLTFFRQPANITMDTNDVEVVRFNALGGSDDVTVNDLTGTDVLLTELELASAIGGNASDGAVDNVIVNATNGVDTIDLAGNGSGVDVTGLASAVSVTHADSTDTLSVNTLGGADNVSAAGIAGAMQVSVDGSPL
jgi:hypothetical protein